MITYVTGNLFQSPAQVLVNTVNIVGVMGKGVALEFKKIYPDMFKEYQAICERGEFDIGTLWLYKSPNKWVLNFPTKVHWRHPSKVEYVVAGLEKFVKTYSELGIHSIAFPPLGSGNGELDFKSQVQPIMQEYLSNLPIEIFIHPNRDDSFFVPEHGDVKQMRKWLRSEPTSLPFTEVWGDIKKILRDQTEFNTLANDHPFSARITEKRLGIEILISDKRRFISYDRLMQVWQQLKNHGFTWRTIAPGISRRTYYLYPIFSKLSYVKLVKLGGNYSTFNQSSLIGLQLLPIGIDRNKGATQLSMFQPATIAE